MNTPFGEQALAIVSAQFTIPEVSPYSDNMHSLTRELSIVAWDGQMCGAQNWG